MARRRDGSTERAWRARLRRQRRSGLTVAEFCDWEGVSTASFYAWKRRLKNAGASTARGKTRRSAGVAGTGRRGSQAQPLFVPVSVKPTAGDVRIDLPGGAAVHIAHDTDERLLRACIRAAAEIGREAEGPSC